jgi:hypothetical protein
MNRRIHGFHVIHCIHAGHVSLKYMQQVAGVIEVTKVITQEMMMRLLLMTG